MSQIKSPKVFAINAPVAGNYPQGLYKYPFKVGTQEKELFLQTLEWSPKVSKTFDTNTQYTASLTLEPVDSQDTFNGTTLKDIEGLPKDGVKDISLSGDGGSLVIKILFEATAGKKADAKIIFSEEFAGPLDTAKWDLCPEMNRQGHSTWKDDMVSIRDGLLHLKFIRDPALGAEKAKDPSLAETWIRGGAIRTQTKDGNILFSHSFGYYESRIKFPVVSGTWGAFWLMSPTQRFISEDGRNGTEIDIVETIGCHNGKYNAALHWNGYGEKHKSTSSGKGEKPVKIFDGEFHVFALDWSPEEYIFYVDGKEFWRVDGGENFNNSNINQNPNYIKLTVESAPPAEWIGTVPKDFVEAEMLVDYVRVYNQPRI